MSIRRRKNGTLFVDDKEIEVPDGQPLQEFAEKLGVPFGCQSGVCGSCEVKVEEGANNLTDPTEAEEFFELDKGHRLTCQCTMKGGKVRINYQDL